jgi:hypothetical protein
MHVKMSPIGTVAAGDTRQVGRGLAYCCRGANFGTWGATVCFPLCTDAIPCLLDHSSMLLWPIIWTLPQAVSPAYWILRGAGGLWNALDSSSQFYMLLLTTTAVYSLPAPRVLQMYLCYTMVGIWWKWQPVCVRELHEHIVYEYLFRFLVHYMPMDFSTFLWPCGLVLAGIVLIFPVDLCVSDPIVEPCPIH